ncbi:sugar transferase [candidate division KSB1 bacterium]
MSGKESKDKKQRKARELITLFIIDGISLFLSLYLVYLLRFRSGIIENYVTIPAKGFVFASIAMILFWYFILSIFGLYRYKFVVSRLEELVTVFKAGTIGILIVFFITVNPSQPVTLSKIVLFNYWIFIITFTGIGRITFRTVQKKRRIRGYGLIKTMIIGEGDKAIDLYNRILNYPDLGLKVACYVSKKIPEKISQDDNMVIIGKFREIPDLIEKYDVQQVIVSVENITKAEIKEIINVCDGKFTDLKITSDIVDIASGLAKSDSFYGIPLIDIFTTRKGIYVSVIKRLFDILFSVVTLIILFPLFVFTGILIKLDSKGNIFYRQKRVGKDKKIFEIHKFRTMIEGAEKLTGPVWAVSDDTRITRIGRILRKTRIDELPQFINILEGDMSLVGPRPERPVFVEEFINEIPFYRKRLSFKPGITGWAQVKKSYDASIDDVKQKLELDLFYIENISFMLDLKIMLKTAGTVFTRKGR